MIKSASKDCIVHLELGTTITVTAADSSASPIMRSVYPQVITLSAVRCRLCTVLTVLIYFFFNFGKGSSADSSVVEQVIAAH